MCLHQHVAALVPERLEHAAALGAALVIGGPSASNQRGRCPGHSRGANEKLVALGAAPEAFATDLVLGDDLYNRLVYI